MANVYVTADKRLQTLQESYDILEQRASRDRVDSEMERERLHKEVQDLKSQLLVGKQ